MSTAPNSAGNGTRVERRVRVLAEVVVTAINAPEDWLSRVRDDFPYKHFDGSPLSEDEGLFMLVDNAVRNGVEDASRLDGWGDLDRGVLTMHVQHVEVDDA